MSNSGEQTLEENNPLPSTDQNPNQSREWETMAKAWVSVFAGAKDVSISQVESWIDSNYSSLPSDLQSMPRADIIDRLLSIQRYFSYPNQAVGVHQVDVPHARFQRTDQWLPVYSWLESLDRDEAVKSKDISDWLTNNPDIREQLCSKHSRYHLMHYIKKCHLKILKRRDKKKVLPQTDQPMSPKVQSNQAIKESTPVPSNALVNVPKESDLYELKRNEAIRKYEILVELEKVLLPHFSKCQAVKN